MTVETVIVGGGVSGLATAYHLRRRGHRVRVLERQVLGGGNAVSERIGGFLMEHGPSSVNVGAPYAAALERLLELDGGRCELGSAVRYRYLTGAGRLHQIAVHPLGFFTSDYLSWRSRLRVLAEVAVPRRDGGGEESVAAFCSRRFGTEFAARVIDPLVGGVFAARAEETSVAAVFPQLVEMERQFGSVTRGVLIRRRSGGRMPGRRLYSWLDGVGSLPRALIQRLGPDLETGAAVRRIRPDPQGFRVEFGAAGSLVAKSVVVATQPHVAATLLETVDRNAAEAAAAIDAPPLAVVFLGYRRGQVEHPLDGIGYLTPSSEGGALSGALFCSSMFPGRAPEGCVALAGYLGGARAPDLARLPPREMIALAREEFRQRLDARGEPVVVRWRQWPRGLPQYTMGHGERIAAIQGVEKRHPGFFVTGNYFAGPAIATCLEQAGETAERVHAFLRGADSDRGRDAPDLSSAAPASAVLGRAGAM